MEKYKIIIEELSNKFDHIKSNKHLFKFNVLNNDNISLSEIHPFIVKDDNEDKINIYINMKMLNYLDTEEITFILAHELAHLEQFLENPYNITYSECELHALRSNFTKFRLIIAPILIYKSIKLQNKFLLLVGMGLQIFNLLSIKLLLKRRNLEYDADKKAINILKTKTGGIKFTSRKLYKSYIDFLKSEDWITHPFNSYRLSELLKY